ncbi:MAG: hypothetical protein E7218_05045 [Anaerofustis stercorihominis]|nr:hypothetical protein [Anaerofustis stercorihominis]
MKTYKRYLCMILALLMMLPFASCGGETPDGKTLLLEAMENTKDYDYEIAVNAALLQSGVSTDTKIKLDGTKDIKGNNHALYDLSLTNVNYTGEIYFFNKEMLLYLQLMDVWMELYLADYFSGLTEDELRNTFAFDIAAMLRQDSVLSYTEPQKDGRYYVFDIYIEDNEETINAFKSEFSSENETLTDEQYLDIISKIRFTVKVDRTKKTLTAVSADFTNAFTSMKELFGTEFSELSFDMSFDKAGKTDEVVLAEGVFENCVSMIELMYMLMYPETEH